MARTTMAELIDVLRGMTQAGTADYTLGTATYWDADQMQRVLDRYRLEVLREQLAPTEYYAAGGTIQYYDYYSQWGNYEQTSGGTAIFIVENATGTDAGTATWSADYLNGKVTFVSDTGGSAYYLTGRSYDLNRAASDIWRQKASYYANTFDFSTDNHSIKRSDIYKHCLQMADYYASLSDAGQAVTLMTRSDIDAGALK